MFKPDTSGIHFRPFWLDSASLWFTPGISGINISALVYGSASCISLIGFMGLVQPYLLNEVLQIPVERQGALTGNLAALHEVVVILLMGIAGAISDNIGRKIIFVGGFILVGVGYVIYPLAGDELQLYLFRLIFAVGAAVAPTMMSACIVDYIQETSRGRWIGFNSIFTALGVIFMATVLARTPAMYLSSGADAVAAGRYAFWTAAAICAFSALVLSIGLKGSDTDKPAYKPVIGQLKKGLIAGIRNPRLGLAYAASFIGRGDLVIIATFFSLWIIQAGGDLGLESSESLARAGILFAILQGSALVWGFFMGMISDRFNRVTSLAVALTLAGFSYLLMSRVDNPFDGPQVILAAVLLGIGQVSVIVAAGALMGQEAIEDFRGAIVGVFGVTGAVGILFATAVGGYLFDAIGRTAPLAMMGILNLLVLVPAVLVRFKYAAPE